ncbi:MAG: Fe-S cluster assembly ATPase SufC [Bacilli bacterium]|nr:Fe-S cluster assembly ATPase SufC [Bacilli bacterium]
MHTLKIENIEARIKGKTILKDFSLKIKTGEIHAIMGPNGAGKSTLSKVILGDPNYEIVSGHIYYDDIDITNLPTDERARLGIFLSMQYPVEIEGVSNADFLRTAKLTKDKENFKLYDLIKDIDKNIEKLKMNPEMIHRGVNVGFSGGERKKNEILQMNILKPDVVILDEIDSGLDVDSLKIIGNDCMDYYKKSKCGLLLITHYQRLLDYIKPDYVHILVDGTIKKTGDFKLVKYIEENGYEEFLNKDSSSVIEEK